MNQKNIIIIWFSLIIILYYGICKSCCVVALYLGIKMFFVEYLYNRFPRLKHRHDSVYKIWRQLPTDAILEDQYKRSLVDRVRSTLLLVQKVSTAVV